jgi:hypothetical protein
MRLGQRKAERKINGIKYLANVLETGCSLKNHFKNKDLRDGVKALSELGLGVFTDRKWVSHSHPEVECGHNGRQGRKHLW